MPKRKHTYFKECTQELRFTDGVNCFYLGKIDEDDLFWIWLNIKQLHLSYPELQKIVDETL